ncbi:MAG: PEGA domain-containing protein [Bacteroidota bacterium]|nr:PEGA domain-containing protein [Bacteroidota bacterium]
MLKKQILYAATMILAALLFYSCDKDVSTSPQEPPVSKGFIAVESNPPGAMIYLNGKITGQVTPDSLPWLQAGTYKLTLKLPLYRDTTFYAQVNETEKVRFSIDYFSNPLMYGSITCTSEPSRAEIYINEKSTGKYTPYTFYNLTPGNYLVKFKAYGCRDDSTVVTVKSSTTITVSKALSDTMLWIDYNKSNSPLPTNNLNCIEIGYNDVKWIGTADKGLVVIDENGWQNFTTSNSPLKSLSITCLAKSYSSYAATAVWVGTTSGLGLYNSGNWTYYTMANSLLPDNYITSVCTGNNGVVWIGTPQGLVCKNGNKFTLYNTKNSKIPANWVTQVACDLSGNIWVGTSGFGIACLDMKGNWTVFAKGSSDIPGNIVSALSTGQLSNYVWAGFTPTTPRGSDIGGLAIYNSQWVTDNTNLPSKAIQSIVGYANIFWLCTTSGLVKCSATGGRQIMDATNSKFPSDNIKNIAFDSNGHMWVVTANNGMVLYKAKIN